jgi:hypothetical protein
LDRQVKLANARFRREQDTAAVIARQARVGGPRESITGRRGLQGSPADLAFLARQGGARSPIGGAANIPGSPAFLASQQRSAQQQAAILSAEVARQARLGGARSSVRGATDIPGSPAFLAAQKRAGEIQARAYVTEVSRLARQGGARSPVGGAVDIPGSPAFLAAQRRFSAQDLSRAAAIGGPRSPIGGAVNLPGSPVALRAEQRLTEIRIKAAKAANDAAVAEGRRIGGLNAVPVRGGAAFPGSPVFIAAAEKKLTTERFKTADATLKAAVEERKIKQTRGESVGKRVGGAVGSALIGGGFPLLFGQGVGAAAGGAAGGALGGAIGGQFGFGLSIVGTIVGDAFDEALNKGKTLAAGLSDPIGKFGELTQAGLISSKALEKNIASLIAQGRNAEAAAQIQLDLANNFGDTSQLTALNTAYDELGRSFSQLSVLTAKFVAGPLSDFINKLSASFSVFSTKALFEERLQGASPEIQSAARLRVRQRAGELSGSGLSGGQAGTEAFAAGLAFLDERLGKTKEVQRAETAIATATARQNTIRSLSFRQIDAQIQGYERVNQEIEKQRIEQQRLQDLSIPGADVDRINTEAAQATYRVQAQINDLAQDRLATTNLEAAQNNLALQAVQQRVAAATQLAGIEQGIVRSTLEQVINIKAGVAEAKRREQELGAQIDAARLRGGDAGEAEASRLVGEQRVAAQETKLRLIEGADALRNAGVQLRKDLDVAFLNLQKLRTGEGGLNQFLGGQDRARREQDVFNALLPQLRQAQGIFTQLTGITAPEFSGPTAGVNQSILQFIDAVKTEEQALTNTVDSQRALSENTAALTQITGELRTTIAELNAKDWNVSVNIAANGTSQATGDVVNNFLSVPQ